MTTTRLAIIRGDTPEMVFTLTDRDGDPFDLTGVTEARHMAKIQTDPQVDDADAQYNVVCTIDAPATLGICRVTLTSANTANVGIYNAELQLKSPGPTVITAQKFVLEIEQDVIQA